MKVIQSLLILALSAVALSCEKKAKKYKGTYIGVTTFDSEYMGEPPQFNSEGSYADTIMVIQAGKNFTCEKVTFPIKEVKEGSDMTFGIDNGHANIRFANDSLYYREYLSSGSGQIYNSTFAGKKVQ